MALPGLFGPDIENITTEFRAVFDDKGIAHDASQRTCMVPFIDQRPRLCALLDDARIAGIGESLLGADFNYLVSDGNYYTGDTTWHTDSSWQPDGSFHTGHCKILKIAFYLDAVSRNTGALRVIPGSHCPEALGSPAMQAGHGPRRTHAGHGGQGAPRNGRAGASLRYLARARFLARMMA